MVPDISLIYGATAAAGLLAFGYLLGQRRRPWKKTVTKSYENEDAVKSYCVKHSTPISEVQKKLIEFTLKMPRGQMLGAPEVISLNSALIMALKAKKVLDIGVFTGASSLGAAMTLPEDGKVLACDVSQEYTDLGKPFWKEAGVEHKIDLRIAPAQETLKSLIEAGEAGTYDFAFIDADKEGYDAYYELCLQLIRPGGIIAFDNTLRGGKMLLPDEKLNRMEMSTKILNRKLAADVDRSFVVQLNIADGYTICVKLAENTKL